MKLSDFIKSEMQELTSMVKDAESEIHETAHKISRSDIKEIKSSIISIIKSHNRIFYIKITVLALVSIIYPMFFVWSIASIPTIYIIQHLLKDYLERRKRRKKIDAKREETNNIIRGFINSQSEIQLPIKIRGEFVKKEVVILKLLKDGLVIKEPKSKISYYYPWYRVDTSNLSE